MENFVIDKILTIENDPLYNNSIKYDKILKISPSYGSHLNDDGDINFVNETCDNYILQSQSYFYLAGNLTDLDGNKLKTDTESGKGDQVSLTNNAPMFLLNRVEYYLNEAQIENLNDPGRATLLKGIMTYSVNLGRRNNFG